MTRRQLPLFPSQPEDPKDIHRRTPLGATFDLFERYLSHQGKSENTIKAFIGDLNLLAEHSGIEITVGQFTTSNLNAFLQWMEIGRGVPCSRKTYARRVTSLKVYFKWLKQIGALTHDPAAAILQRSGPAPLSHVLTSEDEKAALYVAQSFRKGDERDTRPELLFRLLLMTGIKKGEAERLKLSDFDRANADHPSVVVKHKTKNVYKERRIALDAAILPLLDEYTVQYRPKEVLFTCTTRNLEYILTDIGEEAEISFKLSFEVMRWTSAVRDYRAGVDEETIREKLGLSRTSWYETSAKIRQLSDQVERSS